MERINKFFGRVQALDDVNFSVERERDRRPARRQRRRQVDADQGAFGRVARDQRRHLRARQEGRDAQHDRRDRARHRDDLPGLGAGHAALDRAQSVPRPRTAQGPALPQPHGPDADGARSPATSCGRSASARPIPASTPICSLSGGERQAVAIARAMHFDSDLIILDEPTNNLGVAETQGVLRFVRNARDSGHSCIFIAHNIHHVFQVVDRIVVMRRGKDRRRRHRPEATVGRRRSRASSPASLHSRADGDRQDGALRTTRVRRENLAPVQLFQAGPALAPFLPANRRWPPFLAIERHSRRAASVFTNRSDP